MSLKTVLATGLCSLGLSAYADVRSLPAGAVIDTLDGVPVYTNGPEYTVSHGKHFSKSGYYFGQKWQCVEFIKRYLYIAKQHRLPNVWGHAKHFFDEDVEQGVLNPARGMHQYRQGGPVKPAVGDLMVFDRSAHGHVGIVSKVSNYSIEIVQQNMSKSRILLPMWQQNNGFYVGSKHMPARGWLRVPNA